MGARTIDIYANKLSVRSKGNSQKNFPPPEVLCKLNYNVKDGRSSFVFL